MSNLVICDFDGLLITGSGYAYRDAFREALLTRGIKKSDYEIISAMGGRVPDVLKILLPSEQEQTINELSATVSKMVGDDPRIEKAPGVDVFLRENKERGNYLALATGTEMYALRAMCKRAGINLSQFNLIVTSENAFSSKDQAIIYIKNQSNGAYDKIFYLDDMSRGIEQGNKVSGCITIAIPFGWETRGQSDKEINSDYTFNRLDDDELLALVTS